jgi:hypothetical protein
MTNAVRSTGSGVRELCTWSVGVPKIVTLRENQSWHNVTALDRLTWRWNNQESGFDSSKVSLVGCHVSQITSGISNDESNNAQRLPQAHLICQKTTSKVGWLNVLSRASNSVGIAARSVSRLRSEMLILHGSASIVIFLLPDVFSLPIKIPACFSTEHERQSLFLVTKIFRLE